MMFDAQFQENTEQLGSIEEKKPVKLGEFNELEGYESGKQAAIDSLIAVVENDILKIKWGAEK